MIYIAGTMASNKLKRTQNRHPCTALSLTTIGYDAVICIGRTENITTGSNPTPQLCCPIVFQQTRRKRKEIFRRLMDKHESLAAHIAMLLS
jgi:hypothetical protein